MSLVSGPDTLKGGQRTNAKPDELFMKNEAHSQGQGALITLITIVIVAAVLYFLREIFIPLALATLLTFLLAPLVIVLQRKGLPRVPAVIATVLMAFAIIFAIGSLLTMQIYDLSQKLPQYRQNIQAKLDSFKGPMRTWFHQSAKVIRETTREAKEAPNEPSADQAAPEDTKPIPVEVHTPKPTSWQFIQKVLGPALHPLATAGLVVVFVIFMLLQREDLRDRLIRLAGTRRLNVTTQAFDEAGHRVSRYLLMQLVVNVLYGFPIGIGLAIIGVPNPLLWGVLATLLRFVPYLGPTVAAILPNFLAFAVDPGWSMVLWTGALFLTMELLSNNFIEPWLYGASTGLSPVAVLVAAVFWTWLWGPVGLFLSTPLTVCLAVLGRHVPRLGFLNILLSGEPVLTSEARFYQRVLADDLDEALGIAEEYLKEKSLTDFYDDVVIPALILAEQDRERGLLPDEKQEPVFHRFREIINDLHSSESGSASVAHGATVLLCIAAKDEADEIAALLLARCAQQRGLGARALPTSASSDECLDELKRQNIAVVCISSVPPSGLRQARYLCRRIRSALPNVKLVIGTWCHKNDLNAIKNQLASCSPDGVATTMKQAMEQITAATAITQEMAPAPVPADEHERLEELYRLELLDTPADELFDRFTTELARAFHVPVALVTLVDTDRVFWKSQMGLPEDLATGREAPRETSICGHVVAANETLVIDDLLRDARFANNSTVRERGLRFYAGAPLRTRGGHAIGTLCILDKEPRFMTEGEKRYLEMMADKLMSEVEARAVAAVHA